MHDGVMHNEVFHDCARKVSVWRYRFHFPACLQSGHFQNRTDFKTFRLRTAKACSMEIRVKSHYSHSDSYKGPAIVDKEAVSTSSDHHLQCIETNYLRTCLRISLPVTIHKYLTLPTTRPLSTCLVQERLRQLCRAIDHSTTFRWPRLKMLRLKVLQLSTIRKYGTGI